MLALPESLPEKPFYPVSCNRIAAAFSYRDTQSPKVAIILCHINYKQFIAGCKFPCQNKLELLTSQEPFAFRK